MAPRLSLLASILCLSLTAACDEKVVFDETDPWTSQSDWPGIGDGKILVTNSGDDTLSFLEPDTLMPVYRAATGRVPAEREGPHHGAASLDGAHYYVGISNVVPSGGSGPHGSHGTGTVDGYLLRYDAATNEPAGEVRVDRSPGDVQATPDGLVLQTHFDLVSIQEAVEAEEDPRDLESALAVVDGETMERLAMVPLCPAAHGMALSGDGNTVFVTCWGSDELAIISLEGVSSETPVIRVPIGPGGGDPTGPLYGPYAASVSPDDTEVWVSNLDGKAMAVFDVATGTFDDTRFVSLLGKPLFSSFSTDGETLYVPVQDPDGLITIDRATGGVIETLSFSEDQCVAPHGTLLLAGGESLAVVCEGNHRDPGTVVRVDLVGSQVADVFEVGVYPDDLVLITGDQ